MQFVAKPAFLIPHGTIRLMSEGGGQCSESYQWAYRKDSSHAQSGGKWEPLYFGFGTRGEQMSLKEFKATLSTSYTVKVDPAKYVTALERRQYWVDRDLAANPNYSFPAKGQSPGSGDPASCVSAMWDLARAIDLETSDKAPAGLRPVAFVTDLASRNSAAP